MSWDEREDDNRHLFSSMRKDDKRKQKKRKAEVIAFKHGNNTNEIRVTKELGRGAFGQVLLAQDDRGVYFAVKKILCYDANSYFTTAQELSFLTTLKHRSILQLYSVDFIDGNCLFVMEYCSKGTLNERLRKPVEKELHYIWMEQLASALFYLHQNSIVHRDLKPENILMKDERILKLADFGIAKKFYGMSKGKQPEKLEPNEYLSDYLTEDGPMGTFAGTPYWVAPEVFDHNYDEKADVFSMGVNFYAILTRSKFVYEGVEYFGAFTKDRYGNKVGLGVEMFESGIEIQPRFDQYSDAYDEELVMIVLSMLRYNPGQRITMSKCDFQIQQAKNKFLSRRQDERTKYAPSHKKGFTQVPSSPTSADETYSQDGYSPRVRTPVDMPCFEKEDRRGDGDDKTLVERCFHGCLKATTRCCCATKNCFCNENCCNFKCKFNLLYIFFFKSQKIY